MKGAEGQRRRGFLKSLREIYLERQTGAFRIVGEERHSHLYFVGGEFYLPPDHRLAIAAHQWLTSGATYGTVKERDRSVDSVPTDDPVGPEEEAAASSGAATWAPELIEDLLTLEDEEFEFEEGTGRIPLDLVGPLPTGNLLMDLAITDRPESELLRNLGGEEQRYVAKPDPEDSAASPDLAPLDAFYLSRLAQAAQVKELLRVTDESREAVLRSLCRLNAVRLILPEELTPAGAPSDLVSADLLEKFLERIGDTLVRERLELDTDRHRKLAVELLAKIGGLDFYELLGVGLACSPEELHVAYTELARRVHPEHAEALGLKGKEAALRILFERVTEAYLTLSDPDRSRRYQLSLGDSLPGLEGRRDTTARQEEEKEVAAHNYRVAKNLALQNDYYSAIELLQQAVRADPQPEYYALLGQCQAENPKWIDKALFSLTKAVQSKPDDPQLRTALGQIYEKAGDSDRAKKEYESALETMPGFTEAEDALRRLASTATPRSKPSFLGRLLSRDDED